jgi:hypothetical protein
MQLWRANIIALIHFSIGVVALFAYSMLDTSVEQEVPRYVVPATLAAFGITMWAGCRCAYSYGRRDAQRARDDAGDANS